MERALLISPSEPTTRMRASIPSRERSSIVAQLIESEVLKREEAMYLKALAVERDKTLNSEMSDWETTIEDGIAHETW